MAANPSRALATARAAISPDGLVLLDLGGAMRRAGLGVRAALVIGFRSLPFESHAWVEVDRVEPPSPSSIACETRGMTNGRAGDMRSLMRRAFTGLVPARVLKRTSKGYYPPAAMRAARRVVGALRPTSALEVVQRGWLDSRQLDNALGDLLDGRGSTGEVLRRVYRLEEWLRLRERRAPAAIPQGKEVNTNVVLNA